MINFVSAIYGYGPSSLYGGRGRDLNIYLPSLRNIANLGHTITLYVHPERVTTVTDTLKGYFHDRFEVIGYDLNDFEFATKFLSFKNEILSNITLNDRNEILCFNKPYWVMDAIKRNRFGTNKYMWIDSGLFHHGIFPERIGGLELGVPHPEHLYHPFNQDNVFNPTLGLKLENELKTDKLFFCGLDFQGSTDNLRELIQTKYNQDVYISTHLVAGIFGGYDKSFEAFFNQYRDLLQWFIDKKLHCLEEPIFSCLYSLYPDQFDVHRFEKWWFYSPGERCSYLTEESNSFYKIFTNIYAK